MFLSVPVTPDPDTARQWARDELDKPIYQQGESLLDRLARAVTDFIADLFSTSGGGGVPVLGLLVALLVVIGVIVVVVLIVRPALAQRRRGSATVLEDDARTASEIRGASETAAAANDWELAVLERFRATIRSLEERAVLDERAGRTAFEAARDAGRALPGHATALVDGSRAFDEVCYGHRPATEADYRSLVALDEAVASTRPSHHGASV